MSIHRRGNEKDANWFYRFTYKGHDCCEGGFRTQAQALEAERLKKNVAIAQILHPEDYAGEMTFRDAADWWIKNYASIKRSGRLDRGRLPLMVDYFGTKCLRDIQPADIDGFLTKLPDLRAALDKERNRAPKKRLSDHTRNHYLALIRALYERLRHKRMYKGENPAEFVDKIQVPTARCRFMLPAEEKQLTPLVAKDRDLFMYYRLGVDTGMRIGEMRSVKVKHLDLTLRHIFVPTPKNNRSRYVPMGDDLVAFLAPWRAGKGPEDLLLPAWSYNYLRRRFAALCALAGIKNLKIHDLRHTFAYNCLSHGESLPKVSQLMGHSSTNVTEKHYGHLDAKDLRNTIERVPSFLSCNRFATEISNRHNSINYSPIKDA